MKHVRTLCSLLGIALTIGTGFAAAQTTANGPYYATPSWDQTMPAATRFVVLSNMNSDAVLDRETGLVWQRALNPEKNYVTAANICSALQIGARTGWRLPLIAELDSLFDPTVAGAPFLPIGHPFTGFSTGREFYWSSTTVLTGSASAHLVAGNFPGVPYPPPVPFGPAATLYDTGVAESLCVRAPGGPTTFP